MRLLIDYRNACHKYAESVHDLTESVALGFDAEINALRRACRTTWENVERARLALAHHEANHGCDRPGFVPSQK